jgi:hypothetical protein
MKALPFFLVIALIVAIVCGIVYLVKKRRQDLELVARQLKLDFFPKGMKASAQWYPIWSFSCMGNVAMSVI